MQALVTHHFAVLPDGDAAGLVPAHRRAVGTAYGRQEVRRSWTSDDPEVLARADLKRAWKDQQGVAAVAGEDRIN